MAKKFNVSDIREKVMASDDIKFDEVYVEEWDVDMPIRTLSATELKKVMEFKDDFVRMQSLAVVLGCVTEDGERVFKDTDVAKLEKEKSFGAIITIADKVMELSGFGEKQVEKAKND